jgi:hypothetical protein
MSQEATFEYVRDGRPSIPPDAERNCTARREEWIEQILAAR